MCHKIVSPFLHNCGAQLGYALLQLCVACAKGIGAEVAAGAWLNSKYEGLTQVGWAKNPCGCCKLGAKRRTLLGECV